MRASGVICTPTHFPTHSLTHTNTPTHSLTHTSTPTHANTFSPYLLYPSLASKNMYPELEIHGESYLPSPSVLTIVSIVDIASWVIILLMLFGDYFFQKLNITPPDIYVQAKENSMMVIALTFFLTNAVKQNLLASGAFEVSLDGSIPERDRQTETEGQRDREIERQTQRDRERQTQRDTQTHTLTHTDRHTHTHTHTHTQTDRHTHTHTQSACVCV